MRRNVFLFSIALISMLLTGSVWGDVVLQVEPATLFVGSTGNMLHFSMDSPDDEVAALQVDILFDTDCFSVPEADAPGPPKPDIQKTDRSSTMDIFGGSYIDGGIRIAVTGIGHSIAPGTGPIVEIPVDVLEGCAEDCYIWDVARSVCADPLGNEILRTELDNEVCVTVPKCEPSVEPTEIDAGEVCALTPTAVGAVTVSNSGDADCQCAITITDEHNCTGSVDPGNIMIPAGSSVEVTLQVTTTEGALVPGGTDFGYTALISCGDGDLSVDVSGLIASSAPSTNCPCTLGEVELGKTNSCTFTIYNPDPFMVGMIANAPTDFVITTGNPNVTVAPVAGTISSQDSMDILVEWTPTDVGEIPGDLEIATTCPDRVILCELEGLCVPPAAAILYVDPPCQVIKPYTPFEIQVKVRDVTETYPISGVYFELCTDTCIAHFDSNSVTFKTGKSLIDSAGWDIKVHYPDMTCLQVWLIGGIPLTENGCLVNIDLVPNAVCIVDSGWECGGSFTDIWFADAMFNEGEPDDSTEDGRAQMNEGPEWERDSYVIVAREGCIDYGCPPVQETFIDVDADGDTMAFFRIPDWNWGAFGWDPAIAPYPVDTVVTMGTAGNVCGGASTLAWTFEWCPQKDALHAAGFSAPYVWVDTLVNYSSFTWPGDVVCYDTTIVYWSLERLHVDVFWDRFDSWACAGPEPILWLCPDFWYYSTIGDLPEPIYSIDLILDYDADCLVPYEVGFEDLDTYNAGGALTYTINEDEATICAAIALNDPLDPLLQCASLLYVGFNLKTEGENAACTTCHYAELSVEHVKINEAGMNTCWMDGWIHYRDFTMAGNIHISDPPQPGVPDVTVEIYDADTCAGDPIYTVFTDVDGDYGWNPFQGCTEYCLCVSKEGGVPDQTITAQDASMILRSLCNQVILTHDQRIAADITCNGSITAFDAALLLQYMVGFDVSAQTCIGEWKFEYVGPEVAYHGLPYVCLSNLTTNHLSEDFEAALVGDVTQNWAAPKVVVGEPPVVTFHGRKLTINLTGDVYSAMLELVGLTACDVIVPGGLEYAWNSVDGVTRIAVAGAGPVTDAVIVVVVESGENMELYGNINEVPFATRAEKVPMIPIEYSLAQNYPNPFNPETSIEFGLPEDAQVKVTVFNVLGQVVTELLDAQLPAGYHVLSWNASGMASGVYFYRIQAGEFTATKRMVLMK